MSDKTDLKTLKDKAEKAEQAMYAAQAAADKDREQHRKRVQKARDEAAAAQQALLHAEVVESLKDRPDGEAVAAALGIEF